MSKDFKKLLDGMEAHFPYFNKKTIKFLREYLKLAYLQGVIDYLKKHESKTN